jgi:hypothetical protein
MTYNFINSISQSTLNIRHISDLAWAGGFVDADGCIGIAKQKYKGRDTICHRLKLTIVQNDLEVLEQLQEIIGESSFISKMKRTLGMNKQPYQLVYDSKHALNAIRKIRPFLRRKHHEADVVEVMWVEGKMGQRPGKKGWPTKIYEIREKWAKKLSRLK